MFINIINNNIDLHNLIKLLILKTNVMEQFKRAKVIMLPTENETTVVLNPSSNKLKLTKNIVKSIYPISEYIKLGFQPKHIAIVSEGKIEDNDYFMSAFYSYILQNTEEWKKKQKDLGLDGDVDDLKFHKIIAITDASLKLWGKEYTPNVQLPQPSQQFIEKYIESYNKGEIITDVLVEYEGDYDHFYNAWYAETVQLKLNSKNNTITIKKLKDSWNKEEVVNLIKKLELDIEQSMDSDDDNNIFTNIDINKWIKENL